MTNQEFDRLLETFGADSNNWPAELREPASKLLAESAEAQASYARAATVDSMLRRHRVTVSHSREAQVVNAVLGRIAAAPHVSRWQWYQNWLLRFMPPAPAALAVLALLGCLIGMRVPLPTAHPDEPTVAAIGLLLSGDASDPL